jgi:hypothetical protein
MRGTGGGMKIEDIAFTAEDITLAGQLKLPVLTSPLTCTFVWS